MPTMLLDTKGPHIEFDTLLVSILYLMSRYAKSPDYQLANSLTMHLQMLENHPDCQSKLIKNTCHRLQMYWHSIMTSEQKSSETTKEQIPLFIDNDALIHQILTARENLR